MGLLKSIVIKKRNNIPCWTLFFRLTGFRFQNEPVSIGQLDQALTITYQYDKPSITLTNQKWKAGNSNKAKLKTLTHVGFFATVDQVLTITNKGI